MKIIKLTPSQRVQGRWLAQLDDGSILRLGEAEVLDFALYAGMELDDDTLEALTAAARKSRVRHRAVNMATARPLSKKELTEKLTRKGEDREDAQQAADWLEELGLIDEREYALSLARRCEANGYGVKKLRDDLFRRGVPREYWDEATALLDDPSETLDRLVRERLPDGKPTPEVWKKTYDYLIRRGFSWQDVSDALNRFGAEFED